MEQKDNINTGTEDAIYNLISVAYHALQGAENYSVYIKDTHGDEELQRFFMDMRDQEKARAARAKELLKKRLGSSASR